MSAEKTIIKAAAPSKPAAAPSASQAKGNKGTDTGKQEIDYDLPSAEEIAAHLPIEPAKGTEDDDEETEAETDETTETTAEKPEVKDEAEADETEDSEKSDESEDDAEKGDKTAEESGEDEEKSEDEEAEKTDEAEKDEAAPDKTRSQQRIDALTARAKTAEEETARLREQMAEANFQPTSASGPLAKIDRVADLEATAANELRLHTWALRNEGNADGADLPDGKGGTVHFEAEQIRQIKANTFENLYQHVPARRAYLAEKTQRENEATQAYPWLNRIKEGDGAAVQQMIESRPYLRQGADYRLLAADAVVGAKLRAAGVKLDDRSIALLTKGKGSNVKTQTPTEVKKTAPVVRRTAPSPARPGVLPNRLDRREAMARAADKHMASSDGNLDSIANSIAANMR